MKKEAFWLLVGATVIVCLVHPDTAYAARGGGGLPFTAPLVKLQEGFTGQVAFSIAVLAFVACGAALIFGTEVNAFVRGVLMVVLCGALMVSAQNVASFLFGGGAAIGNAAALTTHGAPGQG